MKTILLHIYKVVKVILLLLIGTIIVNRAVTPHQHLFNTCSFSKNNQDKQAVRESVPLNCHYYSDFIFYNIISNTTNPISKYKHVNYLQVYSVRVNLVVGFTDYQVLVQNKSDIGARIVKNAPTRGSPLHA